jgi:vacuolar protein 8
LAASSDRNKGILVSSQAVQKCIKVLERKKDAYSVETEIAAFFAVLAMGDEFKHVLLATGVCDALLPLTSSDHVEVRGNSAAALSNLSSRRTPFYSRLNLAGDYSYFVKTWETPGGELRGFLLQFLASEEEIDQHISVWTLTQLLESNGISNIPIRLT